MDDTANAAILRITKELVWIEEQLSEVGLYKLNHSFTHSLS